MNTKPIAVGTREIRHFDYRNGAKISQSLIAEWHKEMLDSLKEAEVGTTHVRASGNSIIIGCVVHYSHEENPCIIIYEILDGYIQYTYEIQKTNPELLQSK